MWYFKKFEGLVDTINIEREWYKKAHQTYLISIRHVATCFIHMYLTERLCELNLMETVNHILSHYTDVETKAQIELLTSHS